MAVVASDWNNRIRDAVIKISSKIPEVGSVVSILIGTFWPQDKLDIFQALKADVTKLVKQEILEHELNQRQSEIDALKVLIARYHAAKAHEKGNFLSNWITEADRLSVIFRQSENNIHLILPIITLALLHLTGLRERLYFGKELYYEDNTKQWKEDLEDMYKTYIVDFLPDVFRRWKLWRAEQVQIKSWVERYPMAMLPQSHATVADAMTGDWRHFSVDLTDSKTNVFPEICEDHKTRICNDASIDLADCISTTFVFLKLLPDNSKNFPEYDKEVFGRMFKGPYSQDLFPTDQSFGFGNPEPIFRTHPDHDDYKAGSGPITKVVIREWNTIDAMQFIYANRQGVLAGNRDGGERHEIDVADKPINGLRMGFSNGLLTYVQILFCDGTSSSTHGNRSGWKCDEVSPKGPSAYKVSSWSCRVDDGPSNSYGPSVIQLEYAPQME
nr:insecticidal protein IPD113.2 [Lygodium flexuosum]